MADGRVLRATSMHVKVVERVCYPDEGSGAYEGSKLIRTYMV